MKTIVKLLFVCLFAIVGINTWAQNKKTETRTLSPFDEMKIFGGIDCELVKGDEEKVELIFSNIDSDDIVTELSGMQLKIRLKIKWYDEIDVKAIVYYKEIEGFTASAGSSLISNEIFTGKHLVINANTGSDIELKLDADYVEADSEQGSEIYLHGNVETLDAEVNTGGKLLSFNLEAKHVMIKINAGGLAEVYAIEEIDAEVTLGGTINYKGDPDKVSQNTSLGGSIYSVER